MAGSSCCPSRPSLPCTDTRGSFNTRWITSSSCSKCCQGSPPPAGSRSSSLLGHRSLCNLAFYPPPLPLGPRNSCVFITPLLPFTPAVALPGIPHVVSGELLFTFQKRLVGITFSWSCAHSPAFVLSCPSGWLPLDITGSALLCSGHPVRYQLVWG